MSEAPEIKVKLTAEDAGVSAAIKELGSQLKTLKKTQDETAASSFSLSKAFSAISASAAALGLLKFGKDAFESAVNIGKLSDKTGISTQTLSVFHKVAEDVGAATENVDKALIKAAKSITDFQQGGVKAAGGFKILNLTAKDFAGLNSDQKLQLVTTRLGGMAASFQKAAATQAIFGKGASDLTLVANALAAEGFDKATAATAKLGLLLDQTTTDSFREAKAAMQELSDAGKGMATQFETGLLPAISDVAEGLLEALGDDGAGASFKELGEEAGTVIKGIAFGLLSFGATAGHSAAEIEEVFDFAFNHTREFAKTTFAAIGGFIKGGTAGAAIAASVQLSTAGDNATKEFAARLAAIDKDADAAQQKIYNSLFPSDEEEQRRRKERLARLRPDKQTQAPEPTPPPAPNDAAAKANLALTSKKNQDEIELLRAKEALASEIDKEQYDKGEIALAEYYSRRRAIITASAQQEVEILQKSLKASQDELARLTTEGNQGLEGKQKDQNAAAQLVALGQIDELQTKLATTQLKATTDQKKLDDEEFTAKKANSAALLEFEKEIDATGAKRKEAAAAEIELEKQKLSVILAQSGASKEQIATELQRFATAKSNEAAFADTQAAGQAQLKELADAKAAVEQKIQSGQVFSLQGQEQIRQIEAARLPVLRQIAAAMLAEAKATGDQSKIAAAEDFQKSVNQNQVASDQAAQNIAKLKEGLQDSLVNGFVQFFDTVGRGNESVARSFENLAGSVLGSLAKMTAQMLTQIVVAKLLKAALGGTGLSGGGAAPSGGPISFFAGGGLIKGPGGPKDDKVPAMLSHGEFVIKADAVSSFGVHNLDAINRGLKIPSISQLALPRFAEGGLIGNSGSGDSNINLGIELSEGLILKHLSSKQAGRIVLNHITNNPKAASKALGRSQG